MISPDFLEILACPACETRPRVSLDGNRLVCSECGRRYPIDENGIPIMLVDDAEMPGQSKAPSGEGAKS